MTYLIYEKTKSWADIFKVMEQLKSRYKFENYSITQTTLEQVFLSFANNQRDA